MKLKEAFAKPTYRGTRKAHNYYGVAVYQGGVYQYLMDVDPYGAPAIFGMVGVAQDWINDHGNDFLSEEDEECRIVEVNVTVARK